MKSVKSFFRAAKYLGFLIFLFSIFSGCAKYRIEHVDDKKFMERHYRKPKEFMNDINTPTEPIKKYKVYIHDDQGYTYRGRKSEVNDTLLTARLIKTRTIKLQDSLYRDAISDARKPFRVYHLYLKDSVKVEVGEAEISPSQIKEIKHYQKVPLTKSDRGKVARLVLLQIVGGIVLGFLIIWGLFALISMEVEKFVNSCFIATMVYNDANAPEVLLLRKYRDEKLRGNLFGELFIRVYYKTSPKFVYLFKNIGWLNRGIKSVLDRYVRYLSRKYNWEVAA